jgi:Ca-activated chloride channel family protein
VSRTMIRNLVLGLVLAASAGVQGLYAQRYPERRVLRAGNALYEQENYPEAEIRYRKAQEQSPTYEGLFNLADALYKQKRYDEALNILKQISRDEVAGPHAPDAYYNLGNTYFQQKKLPEAAEAYKNALRRNPLDDEARYNLAYVLELMKQNQDDKNDQNQNKDNRQNQDQNKDNRDNQDDKDNKDRKQPPKKDQDGQGDKPDKQDPDQGDGGENPQDQKPDQGKGGAQQERMSREEAERMLDALQGSEDNTKKKVDGRKARAVGRSGKNW